MNDGSVLVARTWWLIHIVYSLLVGIPKPQEEHALIMTKFANDCMLKMRHALEDLAETLGPQTKELAMRVGLHSGSVTAGVLRGDRARFQLCGDTMNTAARSKRTRHEGCMMS